MNTEGIVARRYLPWRRLFALNWRTTLFCYIALLPILALFAYVRVIPIGFSVVLSFYKWKLISPLKPFIGLDNYTQLMSDDNFILALKNTTIYSLSTVLISIVLALPLAVFLAGGRRLSAFYQTVYFLPVITPMVPMAIAWKWIYDYNYGVLNYGLSLLGITSVPWLTDPEIALWALVIMGVWKIIGYNLVLFLVGLRNIPASYLEAASLDGATAWQRFRYITFPMMMPILAIVMTFSIIFTFTDFQLVYAITRGGPINSTHLLATLAFQRGIAGGELGEGAAIAVSMVPFLVFATLFSYFGLACRKWQQGEAND